MVANPPPVVDDPIAQSILNDVYEGGHENPAIHASRVSKRKLAAEELYRINKITEAEFGREEIFHTEQMVGALSGPPAWFATAVAEAVAAAVGPVLDATIGPAVTAAVGPAVAAAIAPLSMRLDNMDARFDSIDARFGNMDARQVNSTLQVQGDELRPIQNAAGDVSPDFPTTIGNLNNLTHQQRSNLLDFYGLPRNPACHAPPVSRL
jgi:hypothetical protein